MEIIEKLNEKFKSYLCPLCQKFFVDVSVLECNHTFCFTCIKNHCLSKKVAHCPVCGKRIDKQNFRKDAILNAVSAFLREFSTSFTEEYKNDFFTFISEKIEELKNRKQSNLHLKLEELASLNKKNNPHIVSSTSFCKKKSKSFRQETKFQERPEKKLNITIEKIPQSIEKIVNAERTFQSKKNHALVIPKKHEIIETEKNDIKSIERNARKSIQIPNKEDISKEQQSVHSKKKIQKVQKNPNNNDEVDKTNRAILSEKNNILSNVQSEKKVSVATAHTPINKGVTNREQTVIPIGNTDIDEGQQSITSGKYDERGKKQLRDIKVLVNNEKMDNDKRSSKTKNSDILTKPRISTNVVNEAKIANTKTTENGNMLFMEKERCIPLKYPTHNDQKEDIINIAKRLEHLLDKSNEDTTLVRTILERIVSRLKTSKEISIQTDVIPSKCKIVQTDAIPKKSKIVQTDIIPCQSRIVQTDMPIVSKIVQTDVIPIESIGVQTDYSNLSTEHDLDEKHHGGHQENTAKHQSTNKSNQLKRSLISDFNSGKKEAINNDKVTHDLNYYDQLIHKATVECNEKNADEAADDSDGLSDIFLKNLDDFENLVENETKKNLKCLDRRVVDDDHDSNSIERRKRKRSPGEDEIGSSEIELLGNQILDNFEVDVVENTPKKNRVSSTVKKWSSSRRSSVKEIVPPPSEFADVVDGAGVSNVVIERESETVIPFSLPTRDNDHDLDKTMKTILPLSTSTPKQQQPKKSMIKTNLPCIAFTRLDKFDNQAIIDLCKKNLATYRSKFCGDVTHMIVSTTTGNRVKDHTCKYISAIAGGLWVLNVDWVYECLRKQKIVDEEPYEVLDNTGLQSPMISRLTRLSNPLFKGFKFFLSGTFINFPLLDVKNVITNLGGIICPSFYDFLNNKGKDICVAVCEVFNTQVEHQFEEWLKNYGIITVDVDWLTISVSRYKLISLKSYLPFNDDFSTKHLNYPAELLTDVPLSLAEV